MFWVRTRSSHGRRRHVVAHAVCPEIFLALLQLGGIHRALVHGTLTRVIYALATDHCSSWSTARHVSDGRSTS